MYMYMHICTGYVHVDVLDNTYTVIYNEHLCTCTFVQGITCIGQYIHLYILDNTYTVTYNEHLCTCTSVQGMYMYWTIHIQ